MKRILFLGIIFLLALVVTPSAKAQTETQRIDLCVKAAGDVKFLYDYPAHLAAAAAGEKAPMFRQAIALRKGNRYRFTICTDEESEGEGVLQVFDENKPIGSSFNPETGAQYQSFDFDCQKTAFYIMFISFRDGKEGSAVGILSHVKTL
ncbi:MAG: hypothetical protein LBV39_02735 [Bacteroidales bacterium]|jgi:hypothetical protein|nr:hypothetical protein [Bacteroidales bacterium]